MVNNVELILLTEGQVWGNDQEDQLEVLKKYGTISAISDLVILTGGGYNGSCTYMAPDDSSLKGRTSWFWTRSDDNDNNVCLVNKAGFRDCEYRYARTGAVRPALQSSVIFSQIYSNRVRGYNGTEEVEYGEYPQYAPDKKTQEILESEYQNKRLQSTGKNYTFDKTAFNDYLQGFQPVKYEEYVYNEKKYIRVRANSCYSTYKLSNGEEYKAGDYVWAEVSPIKWLIDDKTKTLISKKGLLSGIRFHTDEHDYNGDFSTTDMKEYLDNYLSKDIIPSNTKKEYYYYTIKNNFGIMSNVQIDLSEYNCGEYLVPLIAYEYRGKLRDLLTNIELVPDNACYIDDSVFIYNTLEKVSVLAAFESLFKIVVNNQDNMWLLTKIKSEYIEQISFFIDRLRLFEKYRESLVNDLVEEYILLKK